MKWLLLWLSKRCSDWSYALCDLSNRLALRANPPKEWVPLSEMDKTLHAVLCAHYKDGWI